MSESFFPERSRVQDLNVRGVAVRLLRPDGIADAVDVERLLGSGDVPEPPYWMHLWPGALALARVVARAAEVADGVRVLELGCGLALPALTAAVRGARVVASDWKHAPLRFVRRSADINPGCLGAVQMDWTRPACRRPFDVCLGADVAYDQEAIGSLVSALQALLRPGGVAWLADSVNTYRTIFPDALSRAGFHVRVFQLREEEDGRDVWVRVIEARQTA